MSADAAAASNSGADVFGPAIVWNRLSAEDKAEFLSLRVRFHQGQRASGKDRRVISFHKELLTALAFVERREGGKEDRSVVSGVGFAGRYICVNTRSLKAFLGRCKSSINGSFQQMGYVALKTKTKARNCILAIMHSLIDDPDNLRQWTVRCVSSNAKFSIISSFPDAKKPEISDCDLVKQPERPTIHQIRLVPTQIRPAVVAPITPNPMDTYNFDLDWHGEKSLDLGSTWDIPSVAPIQNEHFGGSFHESMCIGFDEFGF